jgi:hypothetical protein
MRFRSTKRASIGFGVLRVPSVPATPNYRIIFGTADRRIVRGGDARIVRT